MKTLIIIYGAMGSGKTTVAKLLKKRFNAPTVHYDWLRRFHLDDSWSQASYEESGMAFENLVAITKNYFAHNHNMVIIDSLYRDQVDQLSSLFQDVDIHIFTLLVSNDPELKKRVLSERDSGWTLYEDSIKINDDIASYPVLKNEIRIETSKLTEEQTANQIIESLVE